MRPAIHSRLFPPSFYCVRLSLYPGPGLRLTGVSSLLTVSETAEAHNCCFDQVLARWLHTGTVLGNRGSTLPYSEGESQATVNGIAEGNDAAVDPRLLLEWESSLAALYSRVLKLIQEGSIPGYFLRDVRIDLRSNGTENHKDIFLEWFHFLSGRILSRAILTYCGAFKIRRPLWAGHQEGRLGRDLLLHEE